MSVDVIGERTARARLVIADARAGGYARELERSPLVDLARIVRTEDELLDAVEHLRPELVLLSLENRRSDRMQLLRRMRDTGRHQPDVGLIVSDPDVSTVLTARRLGALFCLRSPFSAEMLRQRLEAWWAELCRLRHGKGSLSQPDLDRLLRCPGVGPRAVPARKGIAPDTLRLVAQELQAAGDEPCAVDVARRCGLSNAVARRYLNHLVELGIVAHRRQYGGTGRPAGHYRWNA